MELAENALDVILVTEAEPLDEPGPRIVYANPAFTELTGYTLDEVVGRSPRFLQRPGETDSGTLHRMRAQLDQSAEFHGAVLNFAKDGTPYWLDVKIFPLTGPDGRVTHFAAIERDITARTLAELELRHAAMHDPLTGLLNRRGFHQVVGCAWHAAETGGSLVLIDVDRFKVVNDTLGHPAGDEVLQRLGESLVGVAGDDDFAARLGGDEFALALPTCNTDGALAVAERVRLAFRRRLAEFPRPVSISMGVATGDLASRLSDLMVTSDGALYEAKAAGGDTVVVAH